MSAQGIFPETTFRFADESRYASLTLGASFSAADNTPIPGGVEGLKELVAAVPERGEISWRDAQFVAHLQSDSRMHGKRDWELYFEESITYPKYYRAVLRERGKSEKLRLEVLDNFAVLPSRLDLADILPESMYGTMIGLAAGMTEAKHLLLEAYERAQNQHAEPSRKGQEWRAPRFCFSFRTATGSPFAEGWGFAIQESASLKPKSFRLWIEQQRTGRELYLFRRLNGDMEGLHEVETLPAAVHGAAVGLVLGLGIVQQRVENAAEQGELPSQQNRAGQAAYQTLKQENREEAEAVLESYVNAIRAKQQNNS